MALFRDELHIEVPSPDTDLFETGLIDSLQLVLLLLQLEQRLGVRIPLDEVELEDLRSVDRLARVVEARSALARACSRPWRPAGAKRRPQHPASTILTMRRRHQFGNVPNV